MTCPWHDALQWWETVYIIKRRNRFGAAGFIFKGKFKLSNFFRQNVLLFVGSKYSLWLNNQMPEEEHTYMLLIFNFDQRLEMGIFILKFGYFLFQMGLLFYNFLKR
jgi:hypothetical protein